MVKFRPLEKHRGGMAERLKAHVLKTCLGHTNVGSNPTPSARQIFDLRHLHSRAVHTAPAVGAGEC